MTMPRKLPKKKEPIRRTVVLESEVTEADITAERLFQRGLILIHKDLDKLETTTGGLTEAQSRALHGHMRVLQDAMKEQRQADKEAKSKAKTLSDAEILEKATQILTGDSSD